MTQPVSTLGRQTKAFALLPTIADTVNAACTHMYEPGVRRHIRGALDQGATKEEIMTVLQLVTAIGIQSCSLGAQILLEELAARDGD